MCQVEILFDRKWKRLIAHSSDGELGAFMRVPSDIRKMMGPNEQVELYIKKRIYHPAFNIESFAVTNERVIFRHPSDLQTKKDYTDYRYNEIDGAKLHKGILRSSIDFTVKVSGKLENIDLNHLPKGKAARACGLISENRVRYQTPFAGYSNVPPAAFPPRRKGP